LDAKTPGDIARQLLALASKATPGPWKAWRRGNAPLADGTLVGQSRMLGISAPYNPQRIGNHDPYRVYLRDEDAAFIAFCRTHAEALARAVIDLQEALDETAKRAPVWDRLEAVAHELERTGTSVVAQKDATIASLRAELEKIKLWHVGSEARADGLAKANEALRSQLETAERAVEAARPFCKIGSFFSVALAAYDAARTVERDPSQP
jgi:hypothetical protein